MTRHNYQISKLNNFMSSKFIKYVTLSVIIGGSTLETTDFYSNLISQYSLEQKESLNKTVNSKGLESKLKNK
jgi:selenophosphate synthase